MIADKIKANEKQLRAKLDEIRSTFAHMGNRGTQVENEFRGFLRQYVPSRYRVGHGEIIDRNCNQSHQVDVVVTNEDHPFTFNESDPSFFLVEGVAAAGEIKSVLTSTNLKETLSKAQQYKKLTIIPPAGAMMHANPSDGARFYTTPPFFVFAFDSQMSIDSILTVAEQFDQVNYSPGYCVDAIVVLGKGYVIDFGDGQGSLFIEYDDGRRHTGWYGKSDDGSTFFFLAWLSAVMPRMLGGSSILLPYLVPTKNRNEG